MDSGGNKTWNLKYRLGSSHGQGKGISFLFVFCQDNSQILIRTVSSLHRPRYEGKGQDSCVFPGLWNGRYQACVSTCLYNMPALAQNIWNIYCYSYEWLMVCISIFKEIIQTIMTFQLVEFGVCKKSLAGKGRHPRNLQGVVSTRLFCQGVKLALPYFPQSPLLSLLLCASVYKIFSPIAIYSFSFHSLIHSKYNRISTLGTQFLTLEFRF